MFGAGVNSSGVATEILCNQVVLGRVMHDVKDQATQLMRKSSAITRNGRCKGSEAPQCLAWSQSSKKANVMERVEQGGGSGREAKEEPEEDLVRPKRPWYRFWISF